MATPVYPPEAEVEVPPEIVAARARAFPELAAAEDAFIAKHSLPSGFVLDDGGPPPPPPGFVLLAEDDSYAPEPRLSYQATADPYSRGLAASLEESGFGPGDPLIAAAAPLAAGAAMALGPAGVLSAAKAAVRSVVGAGLGGQAGKFVGSGLDAPEEGKKVGQLVGGLAGGFRPQVFVSLARAAQRGSSPALALVRLIFGGARSAAPVVGDVAATGATALEAQVAAQLAKRGTFGSAAEATTWLRSLNPEQLAAVAEQAGTGAARAAAPVVASGPAAARETARQAGIAMAAAPAAEVAAPTGIAATAARGRAVFEFAAEAARNNPKIGAKIWFLKDAAGNPVRVLTPDAAAAAKRAGESVSWIKNLWQ